MSRSPMAAIAHENLRFSMILFFDFRVLSGFEQPHQELPLDVAPLVADRDPAITTPEPWYPLPGLPQQTPQHPSHTPTKLPPIRDRAPSPRQSPDPIDQDTPTAPIQLPAIGCGFESHHASEKQPSPHRPTHHGAKSDEVKRIRNALKKAKRRLKEQKGED